MILNPTISTSNSEGIFLSLDFFDDIFIPGNRLQTNSKFDEREQLWFWEYENEEGKHPLYMELGEVQWRKPTGFWEYEIEESVDTRFTI